MKKKQPLPEGWDANKVKRVVCGYENQTEDEALAEDEAAFGAPDETVIKVPADLVPAVRELIARHRRAS